MKAHILVVESNRETAQFLSAELSAAGYKISLFEDGLKGITGAQRLFPDLILLGWILPNMSGLEIVQQLRLLGYTTQIILVGNRLDVKSCVVGLDAGANDYIWQPLNEAELLARVRARLRRTNHDNDLAILRFGDLILNQKSQQCYVKQSLVHLTVKEFDLLKYFMQHPRIVLTRAQIFEIVWGYDFIGNSNIVEVYIRYLRQKVENPHEKRLIHTVRGVGYILREIY